MIRSSRGILLFRQNVSRAAIAIAGVLTVLKEADDRRSRIIRKIADKVSIWRPCLTVTRRSPFFLIVVQTR